MSQIIDFCLKNEHLIAFGKISVPYVIEYCTSIIEVFIEIPTLYNYVIIKGWYYTMFMILKCFYHCSLKNS